MAPPTWLALRTDAFAFPRCEWSISAARRLGISQSFHSQTSKRTNGSGLFLSLSLSSFIMSSTYATYKMIQAPSRRSVRLPKQVLSSILLGTLPRASIIPRHFALSHPFETVLSN